MKHLIAVAVFFGATLGPLSAQRLISGKVGGGFTLPVYATGQRLDGGWNGLGGVGINPVPYVGVIAEFQYNGMNVNRSTLSSLQYPNGSVRLWSATINPIIRINPRGPVGLYRGRWRVPSNG